MTTIPSSPTRTKPEPSGRSKRSMALKLDRTTADSRRQAAAILEVLAGVRTPTEAAKALAMSLPAYYKLESRALRGLVLGCQPTCRGRSPSPEAETRKLRRDCQRLQQELQRYQALARNAQRAAGLGAVATAPKTDARGRRKRKPSVRALKVIESLRSVPAPTAASAAVLSVASNEA
jgi:hypothetical protein